VNHFGVFKPWPMQRLRVAQPLGRWLPTRWLRHLPPKKLGDIDLVLPGGDATGTVWVSSSMEQQTRRLPKEALALRVVGIEGAMPAITYNPDSALLTNGDALELSFFLAVLPLLATSWRRRVAKLRVVIGGVSLSQVSTAARLVAREVGELVIVGQEPALLRVAGQIMAETGLSARVCSQWPKEGFDLAIGCGMVPPVKSRIISLFNSGQRVFPAPHFSWNYKDATPVLAEEIASFAAAEALLLTIGGFGGTGYYPGQISLHWVEHIKYLANQLELNLVAEPLDTQKSVGYN
jgi:hypothetical protein